LSDFANTSTARTVSGWVILVLFFLQFIFNLIQSGYLMIRFLRCKKMKTKDVIKIKAIKRLEGDGMDMFNSHMKLFMNKKPVPNPEPQEF
jgi:hypothetical protein